MKIIPNPQSKKVLQPQKKVPDPDYLYFQHVRIQLNHSIFVIICP